MKRLLFLLLVFFSITGLCQQKEQRVALVIGNGAYKASPLKNPVNDARDMAAKLRSLGFTVIERSNLGMKQIGSTLREFRSKLTPGSVALVFYAGHGLQIKGENFLPAVDAEIGGEEDVPNQSMSMRQIMNVLSDAKTRLNLVFLDACRDNPYARSFRTSSGGLAKEDAPSGTLISFATRPGSVASDGNGRNGLYTGALLEQMEKSNLSIEQVLKGVVTSVKSNSGGRQEPWMEGSIEGEFYFYERPNIQTASTQLTINKPNSEFEFWSDTKAIGNKVAYEAYLKKFPDGNYADLAKAAINKQKDNLLPEKLNHITGYQIQKWLNDKKVKIDFKKENNDWYEYQDDKLFYSYEEVLRNSNSVLIFDKNRKIYAKIQVEGNLKKVLVYTAYGEFEKPPSEWYLLFGEYSVPTLTSKINKFVCDKATGCESSGFLLIDKNQWGEYKNDNFWASFKEVERSEKFILLYDESRKLFVRILLNSDKKDAYVFWGWGTPDKYPDAWNGIKGRFIAEFNE